MKVLAEGLFLKASEMCFVQYMPISIPGIDIVLPHNMRWVKPMTDFLFGFGDRVEDYYVYLTAKYMWVDASNPGNRKGWHIDAFGSEDENYVWCDKNPTECIPAWDGFPFSEDHEDSMRQMDIMAEHSLRYYIPTNAIVDMERTVHRVNENILPGMRTFVKVSVSKHKYNLEGNAQNPALLHAWKMYPREFGRNHPYVLEE
jgi:hypothetical protein